MNASSAFLLTFLPAAAALVLSAGFDAFSQRRSAIWAASSGLLVAGLAGLWSGWTVTPELALGAFRIGGLYSTVSGLVLVLAGLSVAAGERELAVRGGGGSTAALIAVSAIGAALAACASDLLMLLLSLETAAIGAYALVAMAHDRRSSEAAMKYLIQGGVSTGLFVAALAIMAGLVEPTVTYQALAGAAQGTALRPAMAGALLLLVALAFKVAAAPVHAWAPDAYSTAPPESAAYLSGALKLGALAGLAVVFATLMPVGVSQTTPLGTLGGDLVPTILVIGALSILVGSVAALRQRSYTRMLAYAGVAQVGYALLALGAFNPLASTTHFFAAIIQGCTYAVATTGAFAAASVFKRLRPDWDGSVDGLAGIGRDHPAVGVSVIVLMASLAGIPPLLGFWGKFESLLALVYATEAWRALGVTWLLILIWSSIAVALVGAVIALAYYGAVMRSVFFTEQGTDAHSEESKPARTGTVLVSLALAVVVLGVLPLFVDIAAIVAGFQPG